MYVILCASSDVSAFWAHNGLQSMGIGPIVLLTPEALSSMESWEHRVGNSNTRTSFRSAGYGISDQSLRGVINRLMGPPQTVFSQVAPGDREYALQELNAFYLSWLSSLSCPVFNPATPQGLAGRWFHASELVLLAHQAGLMAPTYRQSPFDPPEAGFQPLAPMHAPVQRVIVFEDAVFGAEIPPGLREACCSFAKSCRTPLLGIDFFQTPESPWTFSHATPVPDLQAGGVPLLKAVARRFGKGESS